VKLTQQLIELQKQCPAVYISFTVSRHFYTNLWIRLEIYILPSLEGGLILEMSRISVCIMIMDHLEPGVEPTSEMPQILTNLDRVSATELLLGLGVRNKK
jgi:hypothetical protein